MRGEPHPIVNMLKTEWQHLGRRKSLFLLYVCFFVIAGLVTLATPYVIGTIFNDIQHSITTHQELVDLQLKIALLLGLTLLFQIFHITGRVIEQKTGFSVRRNYVNDKVGKVLDLPMKWHKDHHSGDTIDKINQASSVLEEFSSHYTFQIVYGIVGFLGSIIIMFFIDWKIGLFVLIFSLLTIFAISRIDRNLEKKYREISRYNNKYSATIFDYLSNVVTIITLRLKRIVSREVDARQAASYPTFRRAVVISELKWTMSNIVIQAMIVGVLIYRSSSEFALTGTIMIGTLYMLYGYLTHVGDTFFRFADIYGNIIRMNAKISGVHAIDRTHSGVEKSPASRLPGSWKEISLRDVSFTYDQEGKIKHLDHINFRFLRGQKIALVGESGSGKSTILSLIRGLYKIEHGTVLCDGKPVPAASIRDHVTLIPQEPEIFNNTFRYNITMNLPVSPVRLRKALKMAQLETVVKNLPSGLDTSVLEKGVSLSGGEKQRLALARGLLAARDSDILLLDEPTSSVDNMNELKIHSQIFDNFRDKTIISSIHRLHLLDRFDYIYVFSRGKLVEEGTYRDIQKKPLFRKMMSKYQKSKKK